MLDNITFEDKSSRLILNHLKNNAQTWINAERGLFNIERFMPEGDSTLHCFKGIKWTISKNNFIAALQRNIYRIM
jgi:hypothetical protein